jgi:hypothetical protein
MRTDQEYMPELYTEREVTKSRKRNRWLGRVEGAGGVIAAGMVWNLLGWIPTLLVLAVVGYVVWKLVAKPKPGIEE